ncbi:MAG: hypothetical protein AABX02_00915 [archaeon]
MVSTQKVPRWSARMLAWLFLLKKEHHQRQLENVSSEEIDKLEQQFKKWAAKKMHSREIEMKHVEFVRLFHAREALRTAERKVKKWEARAAEPSKPRPLRRRA